MAAVGSAFAVVGVPGLVYSTGNTILLFMFAAPAFVFGYLVIGKKVRGMAEIGTVASLGDLSDLRFNRHRGIKLMLVDHAVYRLCDVPVGPGRGLRQAL